MKINKVDIFTFIVVLLVSAVAVYLGSSYIERNNADRERISEEPPNVSDEALKKTLASVVFNEAKFIDEDKDIVDWTLTAEDKSKHLKDPNTEDPDHQFSTIKFLYKTKEQNIHYAYLLFQTAPYGYCHACDAVLGVGIFKFSKGKWESVYINKTIEVDSAWGNIGDVSLFPIGPSKIAFRFDNSGGGQGYSVSWMNVYFFDGKDFKNILTLEKGGEGNDELSPCGAWDYSSTIQAVPGPDSQFFDMHVLTSGTEEVGPFVPLKGTDRSCGTIVPFGREATYRWTVDHYEALENYEKLKE